MRLRLDLAYDGTGFRGWARQPELRTVQGTLEAAISRILGGEAQLVVAGRTDAGVHATGQVAHLDLTEAQQRRLAAGRGGTPEALAARINGVLGQYPDIAVHRTAAAAPGFDARFSAVWRRYEYRIADRVAGYDPLERHRTTTVNARLDEQAMDAAARSLIGLHDFAAYCKWREGATTIRTLLDFGWRRDDRGILIAQVKADAFCHSMVRALVGACAAVGEGKLDVEDVADIRDEGVRTPDVKVLAPRGLTLTEVGYPADELLESRAEQTRAVRRLDEE
ncbi:MAG: tRNA pseudouridine(38-40) synthase TruA [Microbacterium hominis]|uniref:tRNA pseudouridine(38-40) synthase TruA n=1 Tax=Microbacterium TaxID=33882 RepID=UPI0019CDBCF8|nr:MULTISPECIES: tRNA pseudouridine(38-40) synthase TruA [Microbacterium]MBD3758220.1 tRNA pseudouridine(38-40) synthase TruA [Microbacterium sp.]MBZ6372453.1 tRNA pseudouridine(38-40) synthase TruA [Microbacterium hominis]